MKQTERLAQRREAEGQRTNFIAWVFISLVIGLIISVPVLGRIRGFAVCSEYMEKCLRMGDWVFVDYVDEGDLFRVGEVIVYQYPPERSQYRFGRIIAKGGDKVQVYQKTVYVNDVQMSEAQTVTFAEQGLDRSLLSLRDYFGPFEVPEGCFFIMGDNRDISVDSRNWGELPKELIIGKPLFVYFTWKPDPNAPQIRKPPDVIKAFFYHIFHAPGRIGLNRIGRKIL